MNTVHKNDRLRSGTRFDMKYHILHDFRTSVPFKKKTCDHLKDLQKTKFLKNFDVNLTTFPGEVINYVLNI